jgi:hypothetical protein
MLLPDARPHVGHLETTAGHIYRWYTLAHSALAEVPSRQPPSRHNNRILGLPVGPIRMTYADRVLHRVFLMPLTTGAHAVLVTPRYFRNPHTESLVLVICKRNPRRKLCTQWYREIVRPLVASSCGHLIKIEESSVHL